MHLPITGETATPTPLLTLVIFARNDNYFGNFKYRLTTNLNFMARSLAKLGRQGALEVLVTDWNSESSSLAEALALTPEAAALVRFIRVPAEIAATVQNPGQVMYATCAANVALRRARGQYLMLSDSDTLFPPHVLLGLFNLLEGKLPTPFVVEKTTFVLGRYQLPRALVKRQPGPEEWERFLLMNAWEIPLDRGYTGLGTHGAGQMMHRDLWFECRGYNEALKHGPWMDGELTARVTQCYPWVNLASLGIAVFHMEHESSALFSTNRYLVHPTLAANDADWGMAGHTFEVMTATPRAPGDSVGDPLGASTAEQAGAAASVRSVNPEQTGAAASVRSAMAAGEGAGLTTGPSASALALPLPTWNQSREELLAELTGQWVRKQVYLVRQHLEVFLESLKSEADKTMQRHLQMDQDDLDRVAEVLNYETTDLAVLFGLAWYSLFHHPRNYVEYGIQRWHTAPMVAAVNPYVEIYGIDAWADGPGKPVPSSYFLTYLLQATRYRGYVRFVTGNPATALERLQASAIYPFAFDLGLLRGDVVGENAGAELKALVAMLSPGGALVFTHTSEEAFRAAWEAARNAHPHLTFVRFEGARAGIVLAATLATSTPGEELVATGV